MCKLVWAFVVRKQLSQGFSHWDTCDVLSPGFLASALLYTPDRAIMLMHFQKLKLWHLYLLWNFVLHFEDARLLQLRHARVLTGSCKTGKVFVWLAYKSSYPCICLANAIRLLYNHCAITLHFIPMLSQINLDYIPLKIAQLMQSYTAGTVQHHSLSCGSMR